MKYLLHCFIGSFTYVKDLNTSSTTGHLFIIYILNNPPSPHFSSNSSPAPVHCLFPHIVPALWLPHSCRWGNSMWKYVQRFASSPSLDLTCTLSSLFPQLFYQAVLHVLCSHLYDKNRNKILLSFIIYTPHSLGNDTLFIASTPLSLTPSDYFVGVGIIYCEVCIW